MKQTNSFANKVRLMMSHMGRGGNEVAILDIADGLDMVYGHEKRPLYATMRDFCKAGEIKKVRPGVYIYIGKKKERPQLQQVMWKSLRVRRTVSVESLMEISGAARGYVQQWLQLMVKNGVLRKNKNRTFSLIHDPVDMPKNDDKAAYLRGLREAKKQAEGVVGMLAKLIEKGK